DRARYSCLRAPPHPWPTEVLVRDSSKARAGPPLTLRGSASQWPARMKRGRALKPAPFGFAKAKSVEHAIALLGEHSDARILAGGQSLIATLNMRLSAPKLLIDINALDELKRIAVAGDWLAGGALVRHPEA